MELLGENHLVGVVFSVNRDDYKNATSKLFQSKAGNAYAFCTYLCVLDICNWAKKHKSQEVSIAIEDGQKYKKHIEKSLKKAMNNWDDMIPKYADIVEVSIVKKMCLSRLMPQIF